MNPNWNPNYDSVAKAFVQQYYALMDGDSASRANLANFYSESKSLLTFEGQQFMGRVAIMEKLQGLSFQKIYHAPTATDAQPTMDGGVLIVVMGQLRTDDDPPHTFNQTFVLRPAEGSFYVEHDIFRLCLHS